MIGRREVVGGSMIAGLAALAPHEAAVQQSDRTATDVAAAIDRLRKYLEDTRDPCALGQCGVMDAIRMQQKTFLKANQKFPDFLDLGVESWMAVYDWHVKNRQPIRATQMADGRYGLAYMFTTLVLRSEQTGTFVGFGYDAR